MEQTLNAELNNQGTVTVRQALTLNRPGAAHQNSGHITIAAGSLTVSQSGTAPSFTNTGTLDVQSATFTITGGDFALGGSGVLLSGPAGTINLAASLHGFTGNANQFAPQGTVNINGSGTMGAPQFVQVMSVDQGGVSQGFQHNYGFGSIVLGSNNYVRLVDDTMNGRALYVNNLVIPAGTTLDLNGFHVYTRILQNAGSTQNGMITLLPPGGPAILGVAGAGTIVSDSQFDE